MAFSLKVKDVTGQEFEHTVACIEDVSVSKNMDGRYTPLCRDEEDDDDWLWENCFESA